MWGRNMISAAAAAVMEKTSTAPAAMSFAFFRKVTVAGFKDINGFFYSCVEHFQ